MFTVTHAEGITKDNDYYFLDANRAALTTADGEATISFRKGVGNMMVHIKPSRPEFRQAIIDNLLAANRMIGVKIIFSKSLGISQTISFSVEM